MRVLERHELAELKTPSYFSLLPTPCPLMATQNLMSDIRALLSSIANCVSSSMPRCRASFLAPSSPRFIIDQQSPTMVLRVDTCLPPPATNVHYSTFLEPGIDGVQGAVVLGMKAPHRDRKLIQADSMFWPVTSAPACLGSHYSISFCS